jgi:hypothetical protein
MEVPSIFSVGKKFGVQLPQYVTSEFVKWFINHCTGKVYPVFRQKLGFQQDIGHFFIAVIAPALPDILHIAPFENPFDDKIGFGIIVNLLKVHIPENALVKYGFLFRFHTTKIRKGNGFDLKYPRKSLGR